MHQAVTRTICEPLGDLFQYEGEVLWSCTNKHANKRSVRLDELTVHGCPGHCDDSLGKGRVYPLQAGDDMRQCGDPQPKLGSRSRCVVRWTLEIELADQLVEIFRISL